MRRATAKNREMTCYIRFSTESTQASRHDVHNQYRSKLEEYISLVFRASGLVMARQSTMVKNDICIGFGVDYSRERRIENPVGYTDRVPLTKTIQISQYIATNHRV